MSHTTTFQHQAFRGKVEQGTMPKGLSLSNYALVIFWLQALEAVERWIVCTPLSVNIFVTFATQ
jgi:hypothetical protein